MKRNILMNPGPVTTTTSVKGALIVDDICHREAAFMEIIKDVRQKLLLVSGADDTYSSVLFTSSGTGAIEACISSLIHEGKALAVLNNGAYGQRIIDIAKRYKIPVFEFNYTSDEYAPIEELKRCFIKHPEISYVAMVHHETSSGVLNPLSEIGAVCKENGVGFIVDAMSSFGGSELNVIDSKVDFIISSANKCIQGMAGLAFVIGKKSQIIAAKGKSRSYYLDLYQQYQSLEETGQLPYTPPVQIVYALKQALCELITETVEGRVARYHANYDLLTKGLSSLGFECLTPEDKASKLLLTVRFPKGSKMHSFGSLHNALLEQNITIYPTKDNDENTFRLACIGDLHRKDIEIFLDRLQSYMLTN